MLANGDDSGLDGWHYKPGGAALSVEIDDVDKELYRKYVEETIQVLRRLPGELKSDRDEHRDTNVHDIEATRLDCFQIFLPASLIEVFKHNVNRVLRVRGLKKTTVMEMRGIIILHVLASSYGESVTTICDDKQEDFLFQMGIKAQRYHQVWSALSCTPRHIQRAEHEEKTWKLKSRRGNEFVTGFEEQIAAVNRNLVYVPNATVLSLDDHHLRLSSCAVETMTELRSINNPKKALGPVCNAVCSALNPFLLACHNYRPREGLQDLGVVTVPSISHSSFVKHKGVVVAEKGCRALYAATKYVSHCAKIEASVYREAYSGRIASTIHNNARLLGSTKYTLVLADCFRNTKGMSSMNDIQLVYDVLADSSNLTRNISTVRYDRQEMHQLSNVCSLKVSQVLSPVIQATYLQSEDPCWFLLRKFSFTSRTSNAFIDIVRASYNIGIEGVAAALRGNHLLRGLHQLPSQHNQALEHIYKKWTHVLQTLSLQKRRQDQPPSEDDVNYVKKLSDAQINRLRICDLQEMPRKIGQGGGLNVRKPELQSRLKHFCRMLRTGELSVLTDSSLSNYERQNAIAKNSH